MNTFAVSRQFLALLEEEKQEFPESWRRKMYTPVLFCYQLVSTGDGVIGSFCNILAVACGLPINVSITPYSVQLGIIQPKLIVVDY